MLPRRIHITGNAGSGKSTLARELARETGLPLFGLDQIVWQSGWKKTPHKQRLLAEQELIHKPEWIIEGVSSRVRHTADLVIFLDRTPMECTARCLKRNLPYLFRSRPELPPNCPELFIIPTLMQIIWKFPKLVGETIRSESKEPHNSDRFVILTNDTDSRKFIQAYPIRYKPTEYPELSEH
jgi:adenylate kinase family enzyme